MTASCPANSPERGDRLVLSNGILILAAAAAGLFVAFDGDVTALIPLFAVGLFTAFTLSQSGMVMHWWRERGRLWKVKLSLNAVGSRHHAGASP